ncbi:NAD(P)H-binding protein [Sorangium sp. So ce315]|uniref:NAD(P)H-binding protein n=1 Tax=Sorangium sp. So ce315 TaxID=3133299 RepID=UPI003F60DBC9
MDKTERLFALMDALRRHRRPVTAAQLAEEQGVSVRTIYRDVQTLIGLGAPIGGETGVDYVPRPGFFLPPLMFTARRVRRRAGRAQPPRGRRDIGGIYRGTGKNHEIPVAGATGTVGREIVKQLAEGGHHVRALSRNPGRATFPAGVEAVAGDLAAPETFAAAFEGVEALHLISFGGDEYAPLQTGEQIVALARRAGVCRISVLLGGSGEQLSRVQPSPRRERGCPSSAGLRGVR